MKAKFLIAAALVMGTAASAQETSPAPSAATPPNATNAASAPSTATNPNAAAPGTSATDQSSSDVTGTNAASGAAMNNGMNNSMNSGTTTASNAQAIADASGSTDTSHYPVCSRTVRDKCVQRGAAHRTRRHG